MILSKKKYQENHSNLRIYDWMVGKFDALPSRKSVKKALDKGRVQVNGKTVNTAYFLQKGDLVVLMEDIVKAPKPYRMEVEILYEDDYLIAINKPSGLVVSGNQFKTAYNVIAYNASPSLQPDQLVAPLPVHRIDQPTSGVLLAAKTKTARIRMGELFEQRLMTKTYHAIVVGAIPESGKLEQEVDGKQAETSFKKLATSPSLKFENLSLVELKPKTGRKHQLRKQLFEIGHPILGDQLYYIDDKKLNHKGLFLHASQLSFVHPITKTPLEINAPLPKKYKKRLDSESKRYYFAMQA